MFQRGRMVRGVSILLVFASLALAQSSQRLAEPEFLRLRVLMERQRAQRAELALTDLQIQQFLRDALAARSLDTTKWGINPETGEFVPSAAGE